MATMQAANNTTAFPNGDVHIDPPNSSAMKCTGKWRNVKSLIARSGFIIHAVVLVVWALMRVGGPKGEFQENLETFWWLAVFVAPLILETIFACIFSEIVHKGERKLLGLKWFSHAIFMYVLAVVPPIWVMEVGRSEQPLGNISSIVTDTGLIPLTWKEEILFAEQSILLVIIIGRWLLPKGHLSRGELSSLLLLYLGLAADIAEFFQIFDLEKKKKDDIDLYFDYIVMAVWTWSLLQFTLPLTAANPVFPHIMEDEDEEEILDNDFYEEDEPLDPTMSPKQQKRELKRREKERKRKEKERMKQQEKKRKLSEKRKRKLQKAADGTSCCSMDTWSTWLIILMQDGPFLAVRLVAIFKYEAYGYNIFYFAAKNIIVIILLLYRFITLACLPGIKGKMMHRQQALLHQHSHNTLQKQIKQQEEQKTKLQKQQQQLIQQEEQQQLQQQQLQQKQQQQQQKQQQQQHQQQQQQQQQRLQQQQQQQEQRLRQQQEKQQQQQRQKEMQRNPAQRQPVFPQSRQSFPPPMRNQPFQPWAQNSLQRGASFQLPGRGFQGYNNYAYQ